MLICPSILSADFARLAEDMERVANADWIHVDVMDNHFVPNLTLGPPVVRCIAEATTTPLDCHLMIEDPDRWAVEYVTAGATSVTFHVEAARDPLLLARRLREAGARAAIAIKPDTPWEPYEHLVPEVDMVLVMTVEPGFAGQHHRADQLPKVRQVRHSVERAGVDVLVQVDGGVAGDTIEGCARAGADVFVAGSAVFGAPDPGAEVDRLRALVAPFGAR